MRMDNHSGWDASHRMGQHSASSLLTRNIPNALSISRAMAGLVVLAPSLDRAWLIVLFSWATLSDGLDGFLARRRGWRTDYGASLDLAADGLFFLCALLALWRNGSLPTIWLILILAGAVPELIAQAIVWIRKTPPGSFGFPINKLLGGYTYVFVILVAVGSNVVVPAVVLIAIQLLANGLDLAVAIRGAGHDALKECSQPATAYGQQRQSS